MARTFRHSAAFQKMIFSVQGISALAVFLIVSIAANQFGNLAARIKFPLISPTS